MRLARELEGSQESKVELRHLLESLQQMQAGWQQTEAAARAQLLGDKEAADREWIETKAVLARERERSAEARREADQAAAAARQQLQGAQAETAAALEKVALAPALVTHLGGCAASALACMLATPRHVCLLAHPTRAPPHQVAELQGVVSATKEQLASAQLQLREATTKLAAAKATGGSGTGTSAGTGEGGELAQELAAARRGLQAAQEGLAAEKGHSAEYRRLAQLAEADKAEQLRLSAEFKATLEAQLATAEEARAVCTRVGRGGAARGPCSPLPWRLRRV